MTLVAVQRWVHRDALPDRDLADVRSGGDHDSGELVPGNDGQ
jgi:hypothetical protein